MPDIQTQDYELERTKPSESDKKKESSGVPVYFEKLELSDDDKKRLQGEIWAEWKAIKDERSEKGLDELWESLDNQYDGKLKENKARQFNIDRGITAVKVDKIVSDVMEAFTKMDPKFAVTPRPDFAGKGGYEVCQRQSDFMDDRIDNLPFYDQESIVVHNAVLKGTGILKIVHKIKRETRRREETYQGKNEPQVVQGQIVGMKNQAVEDFLKNWPQADKDYPELIKQLIEGKEISLIANYKETTYNDPWFESVELKNFYCRCSTEGYEGLKTAKLTIERRSYSWWELKAEEENENFYDIDEIAQKMGTEPSMKDKGEYKHKMYNILECVYTGYAKEKDKEEVKMVLWFEEETKVNIGAILYPYYLIDCYYVPHYIMKKKCGFYQPSVGQRLTNNHISENAIINFFLEALWRTNTVTPITDVEEIIEQFEEKRWTHGIPLNAKKDQIDFLENHMKQPDYAGAINFLRLFMQSDDEKSRTTLMMGKDSPTDPTAPATKTLALMNQSGKGIADFIQALAPAFNEIGYIILNLYYQMSKEAVKFRPKTERVVGEPNPFAEIDRNDLIARTNIQVQAAAFAFDKMNEKKEDLALWATVRQEPLIAQNPEAVWMLLKNIIKGWSPKWRNLVDAVLPSIKALEGRKAEAALQALSQYMQEKQAMSQVTGQPIDLKAEEVLGLIQQLQAKIATPQSKIVEKVPQIAYKERKKNARQPVSR